MSSEPYIGWLPFPGLSLQLLQDLRAVSEAAYTGCNLFWVFLIDTSPTDPGVVIPATMSLCRVTTDLQCGFSFCLLGYLYLTKTFRMSRFHLLHVHLSERLIS